jgi:hypothetical protein
MDTLFTVMTYVGALLAGAIVALKVIAPMTKTDKDDKALEYAEKAEAAVEKAEDFIKPKQ